MIKKGDRVYHWQEMNEIGRVVEIFTKKNNQLTVGGTTDTIVYYRVEYDSINNPNEKILKTFRSGDIQKYFD